MNRGSQRTAHPLGGPVTRSWLSSIGVSTVDDVRRIGSGEIYRVLKQRGLPVSLNLVYALEGAILGVSWNKIPADVRAELRAAVEELKR